ncbi:hypothetical protein VTH06DRAFT_1115 [Thermothelomyces fergusii]
MSLFGTPSPEGSPDMQASTFGNSRPSLFEDEPPMTRSTTTALFADDDAASDSPWDIPAPRRQQTRADVLRSLLANSAVPDSYVLAFDKIAAEDGDVGLISAGGIARTLAAAKLSADDQARIMSIVAPGSSAEDVALDRNQFNVLLALIGLAQEGEPLSLDTVDERRRDLPQLKLHGIVDSTPNPARADELAARPPQRLPTPPSVADHVSPARHRAVRKPSMEYPEDPWNTPDLHRNHNHGPEPPRLNGHHDRSASTGPVNGNGFQASPPATLPRQTTSSFTTSAPPSGAGSVVEAPSAWGAVDAPATGGGRPGLHPRHPLP